MTAFAAEPPFAAAKQSTARDPLLPVVREGSGRVSDAIELVAGGLTTYR